ncbi:hypothetical protein [uncultured Kordia sp.]|uniref:hypothetical protein n=1 Tax=uncultured Kordia sp. TaxID=507699 RepID=UPI002630450F|nr:hypothetical protein [uncultured Kordia sp.]
MKHEKRIQFKPHLTIAKIGQTRFWTGIFLGVCYAFIFYAFVFCILEIINLTRVGMFFDISHQSSSAIAFEHTLLLGISISMGNHMMIRYWFMQPTFHLKKTRKQIALRITNYALFIEYLCWYMLVEFLLQILSNPILVGSNTYEQYGYFLYLIPMYLFLGAWIKVSLYFKVWKWKLYAFLISLFCVISLSFINVSNLRYSKITYEKIFEKELSYLKNEISNAKENYGITYKTETIALLKCLDHPDLQQLLLNTKQKFETRKKIALKDIVLQKILIHNFKSAKFDGYGIQYYPDPIDVYRQLKQVSPNSKEAKELLDILYEYHRFFIIAGEDNDDKKLSIKDSRRNYLLQNALSGYTRYDSPYSRIITQINDIKHVLINSKIYDHSFVDYLSSASTTPLVPYSSDIYQYQKEFPEFKHLLE